MGRVSRIEAQGCLERVPPAATRTSWPAGRWGEAFGQPEVGDFDLRLLAAPAMSMFSSFKSRCTMPAPTQHPDAAKQLLRLARQRDLSTKQ